MANMSVNQRNQFERVDLSVPTTGVDVRRPWTVVAFTVLTACVVAGLGYATWSQSTAGRRRSCSARSCSPRSVR